MEETDIKVVNIESDEEDPENFFLQPASSPYNLSDKVKEANNALLQEKADYENKQLKIKFREDLVDYEPELSYDEASSIQSEDNIDYSMLEQETTTLEKQLQSSLILNVFNTDEEEEIEEEEEIVEEIENQSPTPRDEHFSISLASENITYKQVSELQLEIENSSQLNTETNKNRRKFNRSGNNVEPISCKKHCIENVDRVNFVPNIYINRIDLVEKPNRCPRLKLQSRVCCEKNEIKNQQKLPRYGGLRSEYGLNALQLERRERLNEILLMKEEDRRRRLEEVKVNRTLENEKMFCEWLKSISLREKHHQQHKNVVRDKKPFSPSVITFNKNSVELNKQRPKTSNGMLLPKAGVKKKRPNTTSSCTNIFIEVPQSALRKGIDVGELLVSEKNVKNTKKLHVMTIA